MTKERALQEGRRLHAQALLAALETLTPTPMSPLQHAQRLLEDFADFDSSMPGALKFNKKTVQLCSLVLSTLAGNWKDRKNG